MGKGAVSGRGGRGLCLEKAVYPGLAKLVPGDHRGSVSSLCRGAVGSSAPHPRYEVRGCGLPRAVSHFLDGCGGWVGTLSRGASRRIWRRVSVGPRLWRLETDGLEMVLLPSSDGGLQGESLPGCRTRCPRLQILPFAAPGGLSRAARQVLHTHRG